ncbi:pheromone-regulated protein PRM7-like protein, partial [Dinothrombium tinctorium]
MTKRHGGCCSALHLREENARFLLLAIVILLYMAFGATIFHFLESDEENQARRRYYAAYENFIMKYNETVNLTDLNKLLFEYGNATASGLIGKRSRWDFSGSFYFVGTVVSTI